MTRDLLSMEEFPERMDRILTLPSSRKLCWEGWNLVESLPSCSLSGIGGHSDIGWLSCSMYVVIVI